MSDKQLFKDTFGQIQMSEETLERVENQQVMKHKGGFLKPLAVVAVLVVLLGLSGNSIVYAMTGESVVEVVQELYVSLTNPLKEEDIYVNGNVEQEVTAKPAKVLEHYMDEEGFYHYVIDADGRTIEGTMRVEGNPAHSSVIIFYRKIEGGTSTGGIVYEAELLEENGKAMLYIDGIAEDKVFDITEDFADGEASGTFQDQCVAGSLDVETLTYAVKGSFEDYTVEIQWVSAEENVEQ